MNIRLRTAALAALLPIAVVQVATAQAPTPGERWRTTMSMEAMGMKMPGMTNEVCAPKGQTDAPPVGNEDCQATNQRQTGKTLSFDMQCKDGTTGTMEMTQESPTRWSGKMVANTREGQMTMRMNSEKLPGECDASEMERKVNKMMADSAAAQAKACMEQARAGGHLAFLGATASCKDKASVGAFCSNARTVKGFNNLSRQQRLGTSRTVGVDAARYRTILADTGKLCGFAPETLRTQFCSTAQAKKEWTFFAEDCPELAKPIAQRECAGRDFTNPVAPAWNDFCSAYAAANRQDAPPSGSDAPEADGSTSSSASSSASGSGPGAGAPASGEPPKPTDKAKEALQKGRDALKGIFGR